MGYGDFSALNGGLSSTPTLDHLMAEGVCLSQHYTASPVCNPSRACLLTGRYPHRTGSIDTLEWRGLERLALRETTLADVLKAGGYATGLPRMPHLRDFSSSLTRLPVAAEAFQAYIPPAAIAENSNNRNFTLTALISRQNFISMISTQGRPAIEFPINDAPGRNRPEGRLQKGVVRAIKCLPNKYPFTGYICMSQLQAAHERITFLEEKVAELEALIEWFKKQSFGAGNC